MYNKTEYNRQYGLKNRKTFSGWLRNTYGNMRKASKRRGHNFPNFTKKELGNWLLKNYPKEVVTLFNEWKKFDFLSDKAPSVDRLNNDIGYNLNNIRLTTWFENNRLGRISQQIKVGKYTMKNEFIEEYASLSIAARENNTDVVNLCAVCSGRRISSGGFKWKHSKQQEDLCL